MTTAKTQSWLIGYTLSGLDKLIILVILVKYKTSLYPSRYYHLQGHVGFGFDFLRVLKEVFYARIGSAAAARVELLVGLVFSKQSRRQSTTTNEILTGQHGLDEKPAAELKDGQGNVLDVRALRAEAFVYWNCSCLTIQYKIHGTIEKCALL
jgi:hypothetical protein